MGPLILKLVLDLSRQLVLLQGVDFINVISWAQAIYTLYQAFKKLFEVSNLALSVNCPAR